MEFNAIATTQSSLIASLADYWNGLLAGRRYPGKDDIDPGAIRSLLPYISLVEFQRDPLRIRYRLVGTVLVKVWGMEPTGRWLDETPWYDESFYKYQRLIVVGEPISGVDSISYATSWRDCLWARFPLSADGQQITHALGIEDYSRF